MAIKVRKISCPNHNIWTLTDKVCVLEPAYKFNSITLTPVPRGTLATVHGYFYPTGGSANLHGYAGASSGDGVYYQSPSLKYL